MLILGCNVLNDGIYMLGIARDDNLNSSVALPKFTDAGSDFFFWRIQNSLVKNFFLFLVESMFDLLKKAVQQPKATDDKVNKVTKL
jgi:hypothetical protein